MSRIRPLALPALICLAGVAGLAGAGAALAGPTVQLQAVARSELPNDEMVVQLAVERAGPIAEKLNREVLDMLQAALARARTVEGVKARLGTVVTHPDWNPQGRRTGWRVRGLLVLEGTDLAATGALAGELSADLQLAGVSFRLTESAREREEARLLKEAADAFNQRARDAAAAFGYEGFELKSLNIDHAANDPPRPMMRMEMRTADSAAMPAVPTDGGDATVTLTISGKVAFE